VNRFAKITDPTIRVCPVPSPFLTIPTWVKGDGLAQTLAYSQCLLHRDIDAGKARYHRWHGTSLRLRAVMLKMDIHEVLIVPGDKKSGPGSRALG